MFDIKYEEIKVNPKAPKKSEIEELNKTGLKSITYSQHVVEIIFKKEDKFEYL